MYLLTCPDCNKPMIDEGKNPTADCLACGWPRREGAVQTRDKGGEEDSGVGLPRKRKRTAAPLPPLGIKGRVGTNGQLIAVACLVLLWAGLLALSRIATGASVALFMIGVIAYLVGTGMVFSAAIAEGFSLEFWSMTASRSLIVTMLAMSCRVVGVPFLALILLVTNFAAGWKPVVVLSIGTGMMATGGMLAFW